MSSSCPDSPPDSPSDFGRSEGHAGASARLPDQRAALPPELRAKILGSLATVEAPTRAGWRRSHVSVVACALALSVVFFLLVGGVKLGQRPVAYVAGLAVAWLVLLALTAPWALSRGRSSVGRAGPLLALLSLALPLLVLGLVAGAALLWPETRLLVDDRADGRCFGYALALGAAPYASFLWIKRRLVLVHPHFEAAAAGVFAASVGALLITLRCDCSELAHLLVGHVLPVLALGACSAVLAGSWLSSRPLVRKP